ncbi:MAG: hypothetical protein LBG99_02925 [Propionibacteriaceae bacterium]|jgi:predicted flap endonuclease-1-like 5' DNA nuclease|nr:hypothetical protein [Propionibacteriaceae bacterium]
MSWFTTGEILIWLILAALLAFLLGWLIRGLGYGRKIAKLKNELKDLRKENDDLRDRLRDCRCGLRSSAHGSYRVAQTLEVDTYPVKDVHDPELDTDLDADPENDYEDFDYYDDFEGNLEGDLEEDYADFNDSDETDTSAEDASKLAAAASIARIKSASRDSDIESETSEIVSSTPSHFEDLDLSEISNALVKAPVQPSSAAAREAAAAIKRIKAETKAAHEADVKAAKAAAAKAAKAAKTTATKSPAKGTKTATAKETKPKASTSSKGSRSKSTRSTTAPSTQEARKMMVDIAARTAGTKPVEKDDLRDVHGIGEVLSKLLYSMNITSFRQVARFEADDIETIASALECFPDRIERDDWMSSARQLHIDKYGDDPLDEDS